MQWHARYDVMSELSDIPLVRFFRILHHIIDAEFGETGLCQLKDKAPDTREPVTKDLPVDIRNGWEIAGLPYQLG